MTVGGGPIGECSISFSKGRSLIGGGVPFSFAVLARCFQLLWNSVGSVRIEAFESQL